VNRAKQLRLDNGLGVVVVAKEAGVHPTTIHKIESGEEIGAGALARLGEYYDVQPSSLLLPAVFDDERSAA
jgi:transcriptional regulator with XRE-family HTH domain